MRTTMTPSLMSEPWEGAFVDAIRWASRHQMFDIEIKRETQDRFVGANWADVLDDGLIPGDVWRESCVMRWAHMSAVCRFWEVPNFLTDSNVGTWVANNDCGRVFLRIREGKLQMARPDATVQEWFDTSMSDPNVEGTLRYYPEYRPVTWEDYIQ